VGFGERRGPVRRASIGEGGVGGLRRWMRPEWGNSDSVEKKVLLVGKKKEQVPKLKSGFGGPVGEKRLLGNQNSTGKRTVTS